MLLDDEFDGFNGELEGLHTLVSEVGLALQTCPQPRRSQEELTGCRRGLAAAKTQRVALGEPR